MSNKMFCFQCEQSAGCTGCTGAAGVCGKSAAAANLQDELTGSLIGLARAAEHAEPSSRTHRIMTEGLFTTITNVNFNEETLRKQVETVRREKELLLAQKETNFIENATTCHTPSNPDVNIEDYDMKNLWNADEDIRSLKSLILFGLRGMAAYAYHAMVLGYTDDAVNAFFYEGLRAVGDTLSMEQLLPVVLKVGEINLKCMALLDQANTETYGNPEPTAVPLTVEKGPFIVITGHDLKDLELLLQQTEGKGINIYTNGEMLPAHAYPKLKAYPHLKGNFGTAWHNQQKEFADIPAPILFTTNCLMPPKASYADRVFTTEVVSYPGVTHIGEDKDFTPVIEKALALGGYVEDTTFTGINGGSAVTTGFGHNAVLSVADKVIDAVKGGSLRHIFLVGGCDGMRTGRSYYTDFVKQTPADTAILTLACGKYRFNDLDLGTIGGLPRIMDMGQCNDTYSAIKVAVALADAFGCGVNDLPLTLVLSWYEQKAVCILLTLLHLGLKDIYLGPTLPAFLSPNVLNFLVENYNIHPTSTPEADMAQILGTETEA
ncbi:MAG TPA: hydroxylamine reductase [Candidatus Anaerobutyricum avicola]|nr:hydroxylamine reductase [Candidatus Anaerobutyricum avicola]